MAIADKAQAFVQLTIEPVAAGATELTYTVDAGSSAPLDPSVDGEYSLVLFNATDFPEVLGDVEKETVRVQADTGSVLSIATPLDFDHDTAGKTYRAIYSDAAAILNQIRTAFASVIETDTARLRIHGELEVGSASAKRVEIRGDSPTLSAIAIANSATDTGKPLSIINDGPVKAATINHDPGAASTQEGVHLIGESGVGAMLRVQQTSTDTVSSDGADTLFVNHSTATNGFPVRINHAGAGSGRTIQTDADGTIGTPSSPGTGAHLAESTGTWTDGASWEETKELLGALDPRDLLSRLAHLKIERWRRREEWIGRPASATNYGPMWNEVIPWFLSSGRTNANNRDLASIALACCQALLGAVRTLEARVAAMDAGPILPELESVLPPPRMAMPAEAETPAEERARLEAIWDAERAERDRAARVKDAP